MKKILFTLFILLIFIFCKTENKKKNAKFELPENTTFLTLNPQQFIKKLPESLNENSGLILFDDLLWTFNDSGGSNKIIALNFSGEIEKEIKVENAKNDDWEDIAQDENYIYIGDFGNNNGVRNNQKIYKIKKKDIKNKKEQKLEAKKINFSFENQKTFNYSPHYTPFDCEALIEFENNLFIFTKDWIEETTSVYEIPKKKGDYKISSKEKFNVNGLITGADISPDKTRLALVGYKDYKPIVWVFSGITNESFFKGKKMYFELDEIFDAQTEGICFKGNDSLLISCERSASFIHQVFLIDLNSIN